MDRVRFGTCETVASAGCTACGGLVNNTLEMNQISVHDLACPRAAFRPLASRKVGKAERITGYLVQGSKSRGLYEEKSD
jgi:hypothetical protein